MDVKYWYQNAIFYEVYVRAFKDSNGDGHGDLPGLIQKLDYLKELGSGLYLGHADLSFTTQRMTATIFQITILS